MLFSFFFGLFGALMALMGEVLVFVTYYAMNGVMMQMNPPSLLTLVSFAFVEELAKLVFLWKSREKNELCLEATIRGFLFGLGFSSFELFLISMKSPYLLSSSLSSIVYIVILHAVLSAFLATAIFASARYGKVLVIIAFFTALVSHWLFNAFMQTLFL